MRVGGSRSTGSWKSPAILPFFARQLLVNFNFKRRVRGEVDRALAFPQRPGDFRLRLLSARAGKVSFLTSWDFCQRTSRTICGVTAGDTDFRAVVGSAACEKHEADATCRGPLLPDVIQDGGGMEARCLRTNAESRPSDVKGDCPSPSAHLRPTDDQAQGLKFDLAHVKTPVPPTWRNLGANVQHILVEKSELLSSIVGSKLHLSQVSINSMCGPIRQVFSFSPTCLHPRLAWRPPVATSLPVPHLQKSPASPTHPTSPCGTVRDLACGRVPIL